MNNSDEVVTRLAPSPSGRMHAGNIFMALLTWLSAKSVGGTVVLRLDDLDAERSKQCYCDGLLRDFEALGLTWDRGPYRQSTRQEAYEAAFESLSQQGLLYPCFCTRADLNAARAPHRGESWVYDGRCGRLSDGERKRRFDAQKRCACRLRVPDLTLVFRDQIQGDYELNLARQWGDFIIRRSDRSFSYQLAVVVDDEDQGINFIVRGADLLASTPPQIYLRKLLYGGEDRPVAYAHGPLLMGSDGHRLSKRHQDASLDELLLRYKTPAGVIGAIAGKTGLAPSSEPLMPQDLLPYFSWEHLYGIAEIIW